MTHDSIKDESSSRATRRWAPRLWLGMNFRAWIDLLWRNRFRVGWRRWHIALIDTIVSALNLVLHAAQELRYGRSVSRVEIREAPVFIIGHWRTGTTHLHELLAADPRHTYATTYACLAPNHFLLTERILSRLLWFLMPNRRPMDEMAMGWDRPQEDEFALANLGVPSPYLTIAFPNRPPQCQEYFDLEHVSREARDRWKRRFVYFLKQLTYREPKRLVLKSPTHTWRIPLLLELFPDARFIHITRDPFRVYPSTVHLWKSLYRTHGLQTPIDAGLEEYVLSTYDSMHRRLADTEGLLSTSRYCQVRFEELTADPIPCLRRIYEQLELGDFDTARPSVEQHLIETRDHQTNRYELTDHERAEISSRWSEVSRRYGYELDSLAEATNQGAIPPTWSNRKTSDHAAS